MIDFDLVRNFVSSPRIMDIYVREAVIETPSFVGDSYLDQITMLADKRQKTVGISLKAWAVLEKTAGRVEKYHFDDASISVLQIWPFDPMSLSDEHLKIAIALSYTTGELRAESRIVGALNEVLEGLGFGIVSERY
ncbi:hypothetical protein [Pseudomonas sp. DR48]|uniref:hypothetical protein n=1 Tax=unclassified Pseudomonas TaxID=196821 RepID=UPI001C99F278|nr:hypothetical protein [Pseudomonas sp. DR48]QZP34295.1 hypothetical protein K5K95_07860 [Pseudomonas sp. DR48]